MGLESRWGRRLAPFCAGLVLFAACGGSGGDDDDDDDGVIESPVGLERAFRADDLPGCTWASPVLVEAGGETRVVVATTEGRVAAYSRAGEPRWNLDLPPGDDVLSFVSGTPAVSGDRVVLAWQTTTGGLNVRVAHHIAVIDVAAGQIDPRFPIVTLSADVEPGDGGGPVSFLPSNSLSRASLVLGHRAGDELGLVYVSFGNPTDIQPWHGWVFEIDLDAWLAAGEGAALSAVLLTTPERECSTPGHSGSYDMSCGGGIWSPSGPTLLQGEDDFEIWLPTGNGQLDLGRRDYANTVMRLGPGLAFDPGCDADACADFDPIAPAEECMASCRDLFIPRLARGDPPLAVPDGMCDGKSFLECYAALDLDFGASVPEPVSLPSGRQVAVQPAKDGAVYLFDPAHFGTMLDRLVVRDFCGSNGGTCCCHWAGTMVTEPLVTEIDGTAVALIPTFNMDDASPAGVIALDIVEDGDSVFLRDRWRAPADDSAEAVERFREHTGRLALLEHDGTRYATVADPGPAESKEGLLYLIRISDGAILDRARLDGPGRKYIEPAVDDQRLFVTSCELVEEGPSHLEGWDLVDSSR
ncbi:MAG TPA: hypothetical protein VK698_05480 [Kofleriaceae bacterium]|nr:hypothetical protein [Kofleriaceae bacterium]